MSQERRVSSDVDRSTYVEISRCHLFFFFFSWNKKLSDEATHRRKKKKKKKRQFVAALKLLHPWMCVCVPAACRIETYRGKARENQ